MLRDRAQGDRRGRKLADRISIPATSSASSTCARSTPARPARATATARSIETAAKPETAIDKGLAGPGLLAYIVTSKFSDYLPLYRLEDIFERQGFEISRATQSVWCGDVADLVEPLYELMAERVRASHVVATDDTIMPMLSQGQGGQRAHVGLRGRRSGSVQRLRLHAEPRPRRAEVLSQRLPAGSAGRRLWRIQRRGGRQRDHARGVLGARAAER